MRYISTKHYGWKTNEPCQCHSYILPKILQLIPVECKRILDAGCGNGYIASKLAEKGYFVLGIDIDQDGIELAKAAYPDVKFEIRSIYDDLYELVNDIDLVISSEVIEHLYSPQDFIKNMYSVIRSGGWIIITTPYHGWLKNILISFLGRWDRHHNVTQEGGHIKFFSENTLTYLLSINGFNNIIYNNSGRIPFLWKSIVCRAQKTP